MELLESLGIDASGFDRWGVHFAGLESRLAWALIVAALAAAILWTRSSVRDLSGGRRAFLAAWQTAALLMVVLLMLQPAVRLSKVAKVKDRAAVLLDVSESMSLPAGEGDETRSERALDFLRKNERFFKQLEAEYAFAWYVFDKELEKLEGPPETLTTDGEGTDVTAAVSAMAGSGSGVPLAGVVLISDGADTTRLGSERGGFEEAELAALFKDMDAPVNTVLAAGEADLRDLSIVELSHDDYGFVHNPFEVLVKIRSQGKLAAEAPVIFKQGGRVLATQTVKLADGEAEAVLSFTPRQVGEFLFSIEVPEVPGELTGINNVVRFPLKVLRDKIRILYIVGNPSWDERFLRGVMKKDPAVDLVSFYILRERWDDYRAMQEDVSLIPFPTHKLFTEELDTFDMVIWQNFRGFMYMHGNYSKYMAELNRFVRERGGALLMIGGHRAFFGQGRMDPMLLDILPVVPAEDVPNYIEEDFKIELTDAGMRHPVMSVAEGEARLEVWSRLPALGGINRTAGPAAEALVLAEHGTRTASGHKLPVIAVREAGEGRVMAVMTDTSWRWNFVAVGQGMSNKHYQRFWENSLRWLLRDPQMRLITLSADKGRTRPGQPVTVMLEVLDETYEPTDRAEPEVSIEQQPGQATLELPPLERFGKGKYRMTITPEVEGGYVLKASAELAGRPLGHDRVIIEAAKDSVEWMDVMPGRELMRSLAAVTGGAAIDAAGDPRKFAFTPHAIEQVTGTKDLPVWDNWAVFLACFTMLASTWYFRRKWGLR